MWHTLSAGTVLLEEWFLKQKAKRFYLRSPFAVCEGNISGSNVRIRISTKKWAGSVIRYILCIKSETCVRISAPAPTPLSIIRSIAPRSLVLANCSIVLTVGRKLDGTKANLKTNRSPCKVRLFFEIL